MMDFIRSTLLWRAARKVKRILGYLRDLGCMVFAFLTGGCSWDKLKSYVREDWRTRQKFRAMRKGRPFVVESYNGKRVLSLDEANEIIGSAIESGKPFMAGRYGGEMDAAWKTRDDGKGFILPISKRLKVICNNAGFFPEDEKELIKFGDIMKWSTSYVDLMGIFFHVLEEWMLRTYGNNPEYCLLHGLDPFIASSPWSAKLEGKRVVVIHPFKSTIESQYKKRELLFPGKNVLPEFQLRVVKAVQTIAGNRDERFDTWFDALEYMYNEAVKEDFDVAIMGCGAYGFPLAAKLKQAGKIAIHLGGVTQLLFGIKGRRWEVEYKGAYPEMMRNPAWVRPFDEDKPKGAEKIENACYW